MKSLSLTAAVMFTFGSVSAFCQSSKPLQPTDPVLRRAPAMASWTITFASVAKTSGAKPTPSPSRIIVDRPLSITVTKTSHAYWEQTTFQSGQKSERWIYNNTELVTMPGSGEVSYVPRSEVLLVNHFDFSRSDFQGLDWLSLDNYKGIKTAQTKPAFYFEFNPTNSNDPKSKVWTAFLNPDTQLPLYSDDGTTSCAYVHNPPPTAQLVPPEKFMKVFKQLEIDLKELHR